VRIDFGGVLAKKLVIIFGNFCIKKGLDISKILHKKGSAVYVSRFFYKKGTYRGISVLKAQ